MDTTAPITITSVQLRHNDPTGSVADYTADIQTTCEAAPERLARWLTYQALPAGVQSARIEGFTAKVGN